jgi:phage terminase small subunit
VTTAKLTEKQEQFCLVYLETGNATEAYRQCYDISNSKPETINRRAKELIDNSKIQARMEELREPLLKKAELSEEYVLQNIKDIAEKNKDDNPNAALKGFELLGKYYKLFTEKREVTNPEGTKVALSPELQELLDSVLKRATDEAD